MTKRGETMAEYAAGLHPFAGTEPRYDYDNQSWIQNGVYVRCGHPAAMECRCNGLRRDRVKRPRQSSKSKSPTAKEDNNENQAP